MRLLIALFILLLGIGSGALMSLLFRNFPKGLQASAIAGGVGAFAGLMMRDLINDFSGGLISGGFLSAIVSALLLSLIANAVMRIVNRNQHTDEGNG